MKKILMLIVAAAMAAGAQSVLAENMEHGGDIIYTKPVKGVLFSHKVHVEEKGLTCDLCHAREFPMEALKVQENADFNMASLYEGRYCGSCHNGAMAFASNTRCASCHVGVKGLPKASADKKGQH
jgi:c(7)-type cytochrome triheme protein